MAAITISREYGSQGNEIARLLCERLGYRYFDKSLMAQLGAQMDLAPDTIADLPEDKRYQARGLLERLLATTPLPTISGDLGWSWAARAEAEEQTVRMSVKIVESLIRAAHEQDNVVVVGRAGQVVLRDMPNVLHVRAVAPVEQRIGRIQQIAALSADAARELVHRRDRGAADYVKSFYHVDVNEPLLYDLVINTGKLTSSLVVDLICEALGSLPASTKPVSPDVAA
jgi:cytidylate kinase